MLCGSVAAQEEDVDEGRPEESAIAEEPVAVVETEETKATPEAVVDEEPTSIVEPAVDETPAAIEVEPELKEEVRYRPGCNRSKTQIGLGVRVRRISQTGGRR